LLGVVSINSSVEQDQKLKFSYLLKPNQIPQVQSLAGIIFQIWND